MQNWKDLKNLINKNIIYYLISILLILGFGIGKYMTEKINEIQSKQQETAAIKAEIPNLQNQITMLQSTATNQLQSNTAQNTNLPVSIYVSPYLNVDIESAGFELVDQLIQMFQATGNKIDEISFNNQPAQGNIGILSVDLTLNTSYINLEKILAKIYTWKYLAGIKNIAITPDQNNSSVLSTKLTIDLYVKKDS